MSWCYISRKGFIPWTRELPLLTEVKIKCQGAGLGKL